jgi:hypothetical protein
MFRVPNKSSVAGLLILYPFRSIGLLWNPDTGNDGSLSLLPLPRHMVLAPSNLLQLRPTQSFARGDGGRWMLLLVLFICVASFVMHALPRTIQLKLALGNERKCSLGIT